MAEVDRKFTNVTWQLILCIVMIIIMFDDDADADCVSVSDDQSVCGTIEREVDMTERSAEDARLRFNPP